MEVDSKPEEIDELDRKIIQLKIEREALKKETDAASKDAAGKACSMSLSARKGKRRSDLQMAGGKIADA